MTIIESLSYCLLRSQVTRTYAIAERPSNNFEYGLAGCFFSEKLQAREKEGGLAIFLCTEGCLEENNLHFENAITLKLES